MARPKAFDEDTALEAAAQLFWSQGYDATSIADLEAGMGMGRQSIYNAFGDKHALFLKALERYSDQNKVRLKASLMAPAAGLQTIRDYFFGMLDFVDCGGPRRGCLVTNSILEIGPGDEAVAEQCRANQDTVLAGFEHALGNAVRSGELPNSLDIQGTARMLMAQTYGLSVLAKTDMPRAELESTVRSFLERLA